ncbi:hypothetical protein B9T26_14205 [Acinetobacter sp. ANC 4169]|uniref:hypothetical protein n=1 Tax=Acinetobacter sp. ANC 4169 TaxID=1977879 RepID=UPI000A33E50D|nr:hypothetical protein [Acinetobacter sp. ANC 4169]OTG70117.1 hypothetical protein B9T26_14205 [Acinetobacter sp. ANC 4169]
MKKIVLVVVCLVTLAYGVFHFIMPEKTTPRLNQFFSQQIKDVQLIQDWLKYRQQQQLLLVDVIQPVSQKPAGPYVEYIKQRIEFNQQNIQRLKLSHYRSKAFKEIQQLEIHALQQWNSVHQSNIVDAFEQQQRFLELPITELEQLDTEARYVLQQKEMSVLQRLQQLIQQDSDYVADIDHSLLGDWLDYHLMQHEIHPIIVEWQSPSSTAPRSRSEAFQDLQLYKSFYPNTDEYKYIMALSTQLWHVEYPASSNLVTANPRPISYADQSGEETIVPEDAPKAEKLKQLIKLQDDKVSDLLLGQLRQAFFKDNKN